RGPARSGGRRASGTLGGLEEMLADLEEVASADSRSEAISVLQVEEAQADRVDRTNSELGPLEAMGSRGMAESREPSIVPVASGPMELNEGLFFSKHGDPKKQLQAIRREMQGPNGERLTTKVRRARRRKGG